MQTVNISPEQKDCNVNVKVFVWHVDQDQQFMVGGNILHVIKGKEAPE